MEVYIEMSFGAPEPNNEQLFKRLLPRIIAKREPDLAGEAKPKPSPIQLGFDLPDFDPSEIDDAPEPHTEQGLEEADTDPINPAETESANLDPRSDRPVTDPFDKLNPIPQLSADMLPAALWLFISDTSERMGVNPEIVLMPTLATLAAVIDDGIVIQPKAYDTEWTESARIWVLTIAPPGSKKSPVLSHALAPLWAIEAAWACADKEANREYERQMAIYKKNKAKWANNCEGEYPEEPEAPPKRQIIADDTTFETLAAEVLYDNPRGILLVQDEFTGLLGQLDAYRAKAGASKDRSILLRSWNGGPYPINRKGVRIMVPNLSMNVIGGVQNNKLAEIAKSLGVDGLLQRFFIVQVDNEITEPVDRRPNPHAVEGYRNIVNNLCNLKPTGLPVCLSPEAQVIRREVERFIQALMFDASLPSAMKNHASKLDGLFARLMLLLHCVNYQAEWNGGKFDKPFPMLVSAETAYQAYQLVVHLFVPHAIRIYREYFSDSEMADTEWIIDHILAHRHAKIDERQLYRARREFDDNRPRLREALNTLCDYGWLMEMGIGEKNRKFNVNPTVHVQFADRAANARAHRDKMKDRITESRRVIDKVYGK
jgi:hypothetical protein